MKEGYIKQKDRKKILLITDDIRVHSGVAQIGREIVLHTCHKYNWVQLGGAINHPDKGKRFDLSEDTNKKRGIDDSSIILYPQDGYGNPEVVREAIKHEKPDAIFLITDPRYFIFLFQIENEIRKKIPIAYLNIWDDYPAPMYNKEYYESCDALFGISKQTVNINKIVLGDKAKNKIIKYIPHGLDSDIFKPLEESNELLQQMKKDLFQNKEYDFMLFFNSRNIRRKSIPDTLLAWRLFLDKIPKEKRKKCLFLLHTQPVDDNGTDLPAIVDYLFDGERETIKFSNGKLSSEQLSCLYNLADAQILLTSNEGWGLSLTEALLTGTPIIANVTGGMQDQMRFEDDEGNWFVPDDKIPSNNRGTYKSCGDWAYPVYPTNSSIQGSPLTPYIWDDRCSAEDAADRIEELYNMSPEERKDKGMKGMKWATGDEAGFTSEYQGKRFIEGMEELFNTWKPRKKYEFLKDTDFEKRVLKHKLIY
jgi:glycosyltransferase involved in cell wall biosynthesis